MKKIFPVLLICFCFLNSVGLEASENAGKLSLAPGDRILVIAPHPDDETIGTAGVIQEAVRLNIPVRVLYLTNGDSNSLAFLYYEKYPVLSKRQAIEMGKLRQKESVDATHNLGLKEDQLLFLGYPDFGTLKMFKSYWRPPKLYRGTLTKAQRVPYPGTMTPGAPYNAVSILEDIKKALLDFKPTAVFVTHPADMNDDHQAAYLFLKVALWDLKASLNDVPVYTYFVHTLHWPRPIGLFADRRMSYEPHLNFRGSRWNNFELTSEQIERKRQTIGFYRTQIPYKPNFLYSFVRLNEPFSHVADVELSAQILDAQVWGQLEKQQATCLSGGCESDRRARHLKSVVYALTEDALNVRVRLNRPAKDLKIELSVFGYRRGVAFSDMPKFRIELEREFYPVIQDGWEYRRNTGTKVFRVGNDVFVSVPLSSLGDPQKVIASVSVWVNRIPSEISAWTFLEFDHGS